MNNLKEYIIEKFKISKDIENIDIDKPITIISKYLDRMIITNEEDYIINEVKTVIETWIEENNIKKVNSYIFHEDFEKYFIHKNVDISEEEYFDKIPFIKRGALENTIYGAEVIYFKKMVNQYVRITIKANQNILGYYDSFISHPILFVNDKINLDKL